MKIQLLEKSSIKHRLKFHVRCVLQYITLTLTNNTFAGHTLRLLMLFKNTYKMKHHRFKVRRNHLQISAIKNLTSFRHYIIFERGQKETSYYQIILRIILMYSLWWLQWTPLPLGLPFSITPLQLNGQTSAQAYHQSWVEKMTRFHNTYSTYLVFLKMLTNGRKKESWWDPGNKKNGHRPHNTLFILICNDL